MPSLFTFIFFGTLAGFALWLAYMVGRVHGWGLGFDEAERLQERFNSVRGELG